MFKNLLQQRLEHKVFLKEIYIYLLHVLLDKFSRFHRRTSNNGEVHLAHCEVRFDIFGMMSTILLIASMRP